MIRANKRLRFTPTFFKNRNLKNGQLFDAIFGKIGQIFHTVNDWNLLWFRF